MDDPRRVTEVGIGLQGAFAPASLAELAERVELAGFDVISVFGDLGFQPPMLVLLTAAQRTHRIRLGPACVNPYTTHPVEIAGQIAYLDAASEGRAYLGLARGAWLNRLRLAQTRSVTAIRDTAEIVRRLLAGDASGYAGGVFSIEPGLQLRFPVVRPAVPLLIGGWGPRTIALAGEIADELKLGGTANPALVRWARQHLAAGATGEIHRVDGAPRIVTGAVTVVDHDGTRARARARIEVAMYVDVVGALDPTVSFDADLLAAIHEQMAIGAPEAAGELIPDRLLDAFVLAGTPRQVASRIAELFDAGASRVELGPPLGLDGPGPGVDLLARTVLPALR